MTDERAHDRARDHAHLRAYAESGDEAAFQTLVDRHLSMVYSAALRQVGGDTQLAEEVAMHAFAELARCATTLSSAVLISGWLFTSTRFLASKAMRKEQRRRANEAMALIVTEMQAESMNPTPADLDRSWQHLHAHLDESMCELGELDRNAIVLRYFQELDFRSVGEALDMTEGAAQKRVSRAVGKLRGLLERRGVAMPAGALGILLTRKTSSAVPPGLAAKVMTHILSAGGAAAVSWGLLQGGLAPAAAKLFMTSCAVVLACLLMAWGGSRESKEPAIKKLPAGLVAWWSGDGNCLDSVGGHHGIMEGNVTFQPGRIGQAFHFDGRAGTRIRVPDSPALRLTNELTIALWFRPDEDSRMGHLLCKRTDDRLERATGNVINYALTLGRTDSGPQWGICQLFNDPEQVGGYHLRRQLPFSTLLRLLPSAVFHALAFRSQGNLMELTAFFPNEKRDLRTLRGQWHYLVGTYKQLADHRVRMTSFFDGVVRNQIIISGSLANASSEAPIWIGGFESSWFKGAIDDVRIYKRELSPPEVSYLFEPTRGDIRGETSAESSSRVND